MEGNVSYINSSNLNIAINIFTRIVMITYTSINLAILGVVNIHTDGVNEMTRQES